MALSIFDGYGFHHSRLSLFGWLWLEYLVVLWPFRFPSETFVGWNQRINISVILKRRIKKNDFSCVGLKKRRASIEWILMTFADDCVYISYNWINEYQAKSLLWALMFVFLFSWPIRFAILSGGSEGNLTTNSFSFFNHDCLFPVLKTV